MAAADLRIGIDVGGTNTDAVVLDGADRLLASAKRPTSADVTGGIAAAVRAVLDQIEAPGAVRRVMLGTTHATNAVVERRRLNRVAVLRAGAPATLALPPLVTWPADLRAAVSVGETVVGGGAEVDGRPLAALDRDAAARFLTEVGATAEAIAITSVFSPVSPDDELALRDLAHELLGPIPVSLGHEVGTLGLLERENATVLNAALTTVAGEIVAGLQEVLRELALDVEVYLAQNDGTLMALAHAERFPVLTIGSGPANSLRGAALLSGVEDAIVCDVGGTTTDIGFLVGGFPRESSLPVEIGGIRTNFRMPDVLAIGVGGGTIVRTGEHGVEVGPQSVGFAIGTQALVFGGEVATLTDAAVAAGRMTIDGQPIPAAWLPRLASALALADARIADAVDRMKTARAAQPLIAVGGGAPLVPSTIAGISEIIRPRNADVANAIGAAIALASGRADEVLPASGDRRGLVDGVCERACARAVAAGADSARVAIIDVVEVPLAYLDPPAVRVTARAAGPLHP